MSLLLSSELGSKENPHPTTPSVKDRIKDHYYIYKNKVLFWNGLQLIDKDNKNKQNKILETKYAISGQYRWDYYDLG